MKRITLFILSAIVLFNTGCRHYPEPYESPREEYCIYIPNMKIDSSSTQNGVRYWATDNGNDNVFLYSNRWGYSDEMYDNEYSANIWFAVDPQQTSFCYKDAQLVEHRCYFMGSGAWGGYGYEGLDKGIISGTKNADGTWEIMIDVTLKGVDQRLKTPRIVRATTFREGTL